MCSWIILDERTSDVGFIGITTRIPTLLVSVYEWDSKHFLSLIGQYKVSVKWCHLLQQKLFKKFNTNCQDKYIDNLLPHMPHMSYKMTEPINIVNY